MGEKMKLVFWELWHLTQHSPASVLFPHTAQSTIKDEEEVSANIC